MSSENELCRLVLYLKNPDENVEIVLTRQDLQQVLGQLINGMLPCRFINIRGTGYPVNRIIKYTEEDSEGKSTQLPSYTFSSNSNPFRFEGNVEVQEPIVQSPYDMTYITGRGLNDY